MAGLTAVPDPALAAYEGLAPFYDLFTAHHRYEPWTRTLERLARDAGLSGRRLLDVGCGTGKSFLPFLERGWSVTAVDLSPAMVAIARGKARGRARVEVADMRDLPDLGAFDLVLCLDDALNYLVTVGELECALTGMRRALAPGGVLVFDVNTLMAYRSFFARASVVQGEDRVVVWEGRAPEDAGPGVLAEAEVLTLERDGDWWRASRHRHTQRHHDGPAVRRALRAAGLLWSRAYGMRLDGSTTRGFDELRNSKAVYVARTGAPDLTVTTGRPRAPDATVTTGRPRAPRTGERR
jgi:SAM-dependent methyltransferase